LTPANARDVAELCARVEGLPLAIELAAARTRLLAPEAMLARLGSRLDLLVGGPRDAPPPQRALRAAIRGRRGPLGAEPQRLLARLAVFVGGFDLEAADEVCGEDLVDVFGALEVLVEHSLVGERGGRFAMLETIREYALELLEAGDEARAVRTRHARHY